MHYVSAYPASKKKINLNSIYFLKKKFPNVTIGYSDHTLGYNITSLSYVVGAEIIEKHFTLSNNFSNFRDHKISLSLNSFSKFVKKIQSLKNILGNSNKIINPEEKKNLHLMRRKLILNKNLKRGHKIKKNDFLKVRSLNRGIFISDLDKYLGKKLNQNMSKYDNLLPENLV